VGVARAPDVVRDLLRPPEVEDRDEPGADRPPRREPKLGRPEREQVLVGAVNQRMKKKAATTRSAN